MNRSNATLKFLKDHLVQIWEYEAHDSSLIAEGSWSFNPGGWLILSSSNGTVQKYAFVKFTHFWFLVRDIEVKAFERDFQLRLGGHKLIKENGRVVDNGLIRKCRELANSYYIYEE